MVDMVLTKTRIRAGVWQGVLEVATGATAMPALEALHLEQPLADLRIVADSAQQGRFLVSIPIPAELLSDGVQTFVIRDANSGATLEHFTILAGEPLEDDILAEIDLLRAELDMLKKAFRRHCLETM